MGSKVGSLEGFGIGDESAAIVVDEVGQMTTYPALYLWNQPSTDGNHTPSWDDFVIPPIG
jgi:hypothetical protein